MLLLVVVQLFLFLTDNIHWIGCLEFGGSDREIWEEVLMNNANKVCSGWTPYTNLYFMCKLSLLDLTSAELSFL